MAANLLCFMQTGQHTSGRVTENSQSTSGGHPPLHLFMPCMWCTSSSSSSCSFSSAASSCSWWFAGAASQHRAAASSSNNIAATFICNMVPDTSGSRESQREKSFFRCWDEMLVLLSSSCVFGMLSPCPCRPSAFWTSHAVHFRKILRKNFNREYCLRMRTNRLRGSLLTRRRYSVKGLQKWIFLNPWFVLIYKHTAIRMHKRFNPEMLGIVLLAYDPRFPSCDLC